MESNRVTDVASLESFLKKTGIEYKLHKHQPVQNVEEMLAHLKLDHAPIIKNLFMEDKKGACYLTSAHHTTQVGRQYYKTVGANYSNCRQAKPEVLDALLGCQPRSVSPFGLINDTDKKIKAFFLDENLAKEEYLAFHPMQNDYTIELKRTEFEKFLQAIGREPVVINLTDSEQPETKTEVKGKGEAKSKGKEQPKKEEEKGETKLAIEYKKEENFPEWYTDVIIKGELIDYYDVSGCYILRPWAYSIWEQIQKYFDDKIKALGVENTYFPMFVSQKALQTEENHVAGFAPEVAWVTRYSKTELKEPIALRPTSETIMYPAFAKWIHSHRDLPLKVNQWSNVVRWEFKNPTPFIRTREFLWQEGHTAHGTKDEAEKFTYDILELYKQVYEDLLAVPVIKGVKTDSEKFAGGDFTTTVETIVAANGRSIQAATSHHLGQNFSKMFDITFLDENKEKAHAWQTSWGLSTRSLGVVTMVHGDDKGLVLPPKVALVQIVIVPLFFKDTDRNELLKKADEIKDILSKQGIRAKIDDRENYSPGWKFNHWELKGVPIRIEIGPKDLQNKEVKCIQRVDNDKYQVKWEDIETEIPKRLAGVHKTMLSKASDVLQSRIVEANDWQTFITALNQKKFVLTPWCMEQDEEDKVKDKSGIDSKALDVAGADERSLTGAAKTLCYPLEQKPIAEGEKCFFSGKPAKRRVLWGRSY